VAEQQRQEHEEAAAREGDFRSYQGVRHIGLGLLWCLGGAGASLCCFGLSAATGVGTFVVATGAIGGGLAEVLYGVVLLLRKGPMST